MTRWMLIFLVQLLAMYGCARIAAAHDFGAMKVEIRCGAAGTYAIVVTADLDHVPLSIAEDFSRLLQEQTSLYFEGIKEGAPSELRIAHTPEKPIAGSRMVELRGAGRIPANAKTLAFETRLAISEYYLVFTQEGRDGQESQWLETRMKSREFKLNERIVERSLAALFGQYVWLGFTHIVPLGFDHILFVLCLYLLSARFKALAMQVTAFTIAHSISLALSMSELVTLPSNLVEPLIAISIVYVAVENVLVKRMPPQRLAVVFMFGLLHGLGFAGVLKELGLPRENFGLTLVGFNCGVEAGQFVVIAAAYLLAGAWFSRKAWYRPRLVVPLSGAIAAFALYLSIDRMFV
jgi:hydrogenase/urease accessory protein HupE